LSVASAALIGSVDSTALQTEPSSLQILTKLGTINCLSTESDDDQPEQSKSASGNLLNELIGLVVDSTRQEKGEVGLVSLIQLELRLNALLRKAEEGQLIPRTKEDMGWKGKVNRHQKIYDEILKMSSASGAGDELEDDEDDK
jgi:hypothetical protein